MSKEEILLLILKKGDIQSLENSRNKKSITN
jgi:hypothetical protein